MSEPPGKRDEKLKYLRNYRKEKREILKRKRQTPEWKARHSERQRAYYASLPPLKKRAYTLRAYYGLSEEAYLALYESQNGKCAICRDDLLRAGEAGAKSAKAHVDHDHATGRVRGLLCYYCNTGLGCFKDSPQRLESAVAYLKR